MILLHLKFELPKTRNKQRFCKYTSIFIYIGVNPRGVCPSRPHSDYFVVSVLLFQNCANVYSSFYVNFTVSI